MHLLFPTTGFILFIAFSLFITAGYALGRKKNIGTAKSVGKALEEIIKPHDQTYTCLGGTIGFRANYKCKNFYKVEATLTLLPRQSPLYYPASFLVSGFDRLYIVFFLKRKLTSEGHIIERKYFKYRGPEIQNFDYLSKERQNINGKVFFLLYKDREIKNTLLDILKILDENGFSRILKHIALVPDKNTLFFLILPKSNAWSGFVKKMTTFAANYPGEEDPGHQV